LSEQQFTAHTTGAQREKMHIRYDLFPIEAMESYSRVAEYGAKKYTRHWSSECQGLANVKGVAKIEISLPRECAEIAIMNLKEAGMHLSASPAHLANAPFATKNEQSKSLEPANAAAATKRDSRLQTLTITFDRSKTREGIIGRTKNIGCDSSETDQATLFLENVINEQNFLRICEAWESRNRNTSNTGTAAAPSASPMLTFTLTTITGLEILEEFFAHDAITVLGFWATISKALKRHLLISGSDVLVKSVGSWNWSAGLPRMQIAASLIRHLFAYMRGQDNDDGPGGSGLPHVDHIIWNAAALCHHHHHGIEDDRRPEPARNFNKDSAL
jgi:hypothetical protein